MWLLVKAVWNKPTKLKFIVMITDSGWDKDMDLIQTRPQLCLLLWFTSIFLSDSDRSGA